MAVVMLTIVGFIMMKFVALNTAAIMTVSKVQLIENRVDGFLSWFAGQLQTLEPESAGLSGEAHEFEGENSSDEITWKATPGVGTLSQTGEGMFQLRLALDPLKDGQTRALRLIRTAVEDVKEEKEGKEGGNRTRAVTKAVAVDGEAESETILIEDAPGLEIRYFDMRVNSWVKRWSDAATLPSLIKVKVWIGGTDQTRETTVRLPPLSAQTQNRPNRPARRNRTPGAQENPEEQQPQEGAPQNPENPQPEAPR